MKIKSMAPGFNQVGNLHSIISEIVLIADPEKILLLTASYTYQFTENIFVRNPLQQFSDGYYELLVLIQSDGKISLAEQEVGIRSKLLHFSNLLLHLRDIHEFYRRAGAGDEFENYILLNAMVSYDKN